MAYECPWWRKTGGGGLSDYKKEKRDLNYLALAYGKMIYASAGGMSSVWKPNVIDQQGQSFIDVDDLEGDDDVNFIDNDVTGSLSAGDVDDDPVVIGSTATPNKPKKTKKVTSGGLYSEGGQGDDGSPKFWPKPHLVSIQTSGMDSLGINQKGSYSYKTYNGFDNQEPPPIGGSSGMSWGWAYGGKVISGCGFSGKVIGWTATANMEGGYDVTVEMLGSNASISAAAFSADQGSAALKNGAAVDALGNTISSTGVFGSIASADAQATAAGAAAPSHTFDNGLEGAIIEIPDDFAKEKTDPEAEASSKMTYKAFIKFSSIVTACNTILSDYCVGGVQFIIDDTAKSPIPVPGGLVSAHPLQLLTAGSSAYGADKTFVTAGAYDGNPADLYIAAEWMKGVIDQVKVSDQQSEGGKTKTLSFKAFFDSIFKMFNENLGNLYTLTLANSAVKSDNAIYITNYNSIDSSIGAHNVGIVRSATCTAKMDGDAAAMFYTTKQAASQGITSTVSSGTGTTVAPDYDTNKTNLGKSGCIAANIASLRADNKALVQKSMGSATNYGVAAPYDLSVTVDGTSGFVYGGVITHDCVPSSPVAGYKVGFAITNIQHSVSVGDWTTSVSTYCRLYK